MLGYCLILGTADAWAGFRFLLRHKATQSERALLAYFALTSLDAPAAEQTAATALRASGGPLPVFLGGMDDARDWAARATRSELKAYALAAFEAMPPKDQAGFFRHISAVEVAA